MMEEVEEEEEEVEEEGMWEDGGNERLKSQDRLVQTCSLLS